MKKFYGRTNAYTATQKTVYYFDIAKEGFDKALLFFGKMFSEPLLDIHLMNKEIEAVNSEHEKNINSDDWRQMQLIKYLSNPFHPFNHFATGSRKTLKSINPDQLHEKLIKFYEKFYTPTNMKLTILGNQDIRVLQDLAIRIFSNVRNNITKEENVLNYGNIAVKENAFYKGNLGKIVWFKKLTPILSLDFIFSLNELITKYKTKPENYFAYLMDYEGDNSLIALLRKKNYATKLDTGIIYSSTHMTQIAISLTLTDLGLKNIEEIIALTNTYIELIKSKGVSKEIFKEVKKMNEINFKFLEKNSNYGSYISSLSSRMFDNDYEDLIYADYRHSNYNENIIMDFLNSITMENCIIFIGSKDRLSPTLEKQLFKNVKEKSEIWYGTIFLENYFSQTEMNKTNMNVKETISLLIRPKNVFITKEHEILSCNKENLCFRSDQVITPNLFYENSQMKIYSKVKL